MIYCLLMTLTDYTGMAIPFLVMKVTTGALLHDLIDMDRLFFFSLEAL